MIPAHPGADRSDTAGDEASLRRQQRDAWPFSVQVDPDGWTVRDKDGQSWGWFADMDDAEGCRSDLDRSAWSI